jgi:hypothetical protein
VSGVTTVADVLTPARRYRIAVMLERRSRRTWRTLDDTGGVSDIRVR